MKWCRRVRELILVGAYWFGLLASACSGEHFDGKGSTCSGGQAATGGASSLSATGDASATGGLTGVGGAATGGVGIGGTNNVGGIGTGGVATGGAGTGGVVSACDPECSGAKPVCNEFAKMCVECMGEGNCASPKPACNTATNTCAECTGNGNCSGSKPACNSASNLCVECMGDGNCGGAKPACNLTTNTCVECSTTNASHCSGATPVCNAATNVCVQCTEKANCGGSTPLCDTARNTCVECLSSADCKTATASVCVGGTCEPCATNADCTHITGKGVCKQGSASPDEDAGVDADTDAGTSSGAHECVQCTGNDYSACGQSGGKNLVCNTLTNTCSTFAEHSAGLCKACVSDAQCPLGEMCVEETFNGQSVGYFCFYKQGDTANGAPASCISNGRPYSGVLKSALSIDGQTADICSLRVSTCTALNQFSQTNCTSNTNTANDLACGVAPGVDSKCAETSSAGVYLCTTTCGSDLDCPKGVNFTCNTGANPPVCTFQ